MENIKYQVKDMNKLGARLQIRKHTTEGQFLLLGRNNTGSRINVKGDENFVSKILTQMYNEAIRNSINEEMKKNETIRVPKYWTEHNGSFHRGWYLTNGLGELRDEIGSMYTFETGDAAVKLLIKKLGPDAWLYNGDSVNFIKQAREIELAIR